MLLTIPATVQSKKGEAAKKTAVEREQSEARLNSAEREQARPKVKKPRLAFPQVGALN